MTSRNEPADLPRGCGCELIYPGIESCYCALEPLVQAVGRRHALQILNVIAARDGAHFSEIEAQLEGISSSTLTIRLHELEKVRLIERVFESDDPVRWSYALTAKGEALRDSLRLLFREGDPYAP